jgi:hypothetical protein
MKVIPWGGGFPVGIQSVRSKEHCERPLTQRFRLTPQLRQAPNMIPKPPTTKSTGNHSE